MKYFDPFGEERYVIYTKDFATQAEAQKQSWNAECSKGCSQSIPVSNIKEFENAIHMMNAASGGVDEVVLMVHGSGNYISFDVESLSANGELITPKGNKAKPIDRLPDINFNKDAGIRVNSCLSGLPIDRKRNVAQTFNDRYGVKTMGYPYWIKYKSEGSPNVIPTWMSSFTSPRINEPVVYPAQQ